MIKINNLIISFFFEYITGIKEEVLFLKIIGNDKQKLTLAHFRIFLIPIKEPTSNFLESNKVNKLKYGLKRIPPKISIKTGNIRTNININKWDLKKINS
jgi:hypothetical protein